MKIEIIKKWIVMEIRSKQNSFFPLKEKVGGREGEGSFTCAYFAAKTQEK
jgi:hypothetical protein